MKEKPVESLPKEILIVALGFSVQSLQVILPAAEREPTFLLQEVDEHQAIKKALSEETARFLRFFVVRFIVGNAFLERGLDFRKDSFVAREKLFGNFLDIERFTPTLKPRISVECISGKLQFR